MAEENAIKNREGVMTWVTAQKSKIKNQLDIGVIMILEAIKNEEGANITGGGAKIKLGSSKNLDISGNYDTKAQ